MQRDDNGERTCSDEGDRGNLELLREMQSDKWSVSLGIHLM
jgi:hypothetical protein